MSEFQFKITGGKGQFAELPEVTKVSNLEPGKFYFCTLMSYSISGEEVPDVDFAHVELMDQKIGQSVTRGVKVVRFLKGKKFVGLPDVMHVCRLDQLPTCTFYGPMEIDVTHKEVGDVIQEIAE